MKKIVLAYSGGLDTSIILRWLQENYKAEIIESIPQNEELTIYHHGDKWHDPDVGHWAEQRCYVEFMFQWLLCLVLDVGLTRLTMFSCLRFRD